MKIAIDILQNKLNQVQDRIKASNRILHKKKQKVDWFPEVLIKWNIQDKENIKVLKKAIKVLNNHGK